MNMAIIALGSIVAVSDLIRPVFHKLSNSYDLLLPFHTRSICSFKNCHSSIEFKTQEIAASFSTSLLHKPHVDTNAIE